MKLLGGENLKSELDEVIEGYKEDLKFPRGCIIFGCSKRIENLEILKEHLETNHTKEELVNNLLAWSMMYYGDV